MKNFLFYFSLKELTNFSSEERFWNRHPALLYGLAVWLGFEISLFSLGISFFPLAIIFFPLFLFPFKLSCSFRWRLFRAFLLFALSFLYGKSAILLPDSEQELAGTAYVDFSCRSIKKRFQGANWLYRGTIHHFFDRQRSLKARRIPFFCLLPGKANIPPADSAYQIKGTLKKVSQGTYAFIPAKEEPWILWNRGKNLSEIRFQAKERLGKIIRSYFSDERSASFLIGMALGDFNDPLMNFELNRFGLQHLLAISGFHFSLLGSFLSSFLSLFFSPKKTATALLFLLTAYFLFLGFSPSIMRAWAAAVISVGAILLEKRSSPLNSLGIGLIAVLLYEPLACRHIGFQFSFAITASILLFFPSFDASLQKTFSSRSLMNMIDLSRYQQIGYCLLILFRNLLALTGAVNVAAIPLSLYYFHKFPLLSLPYNLFFPPMAGFALFLLLIGLICLPFINILGASILQADSRWVSFLLDYAYRLPLSADCVWRISSSAELFVLIFLNGAFFWAIKRKFATDN